jgi:hypothetical protein
MAVGCEAFPNFSRVQVSEELGDFTTTPRVLSISLLATAIGALSAFVALALLRLIGLFTNLFFFGRWKLSLALWRLREANAYGLRDCRTLYRNQGYGVC